MRPKIRTILEECIDTGIEHGLNMANKHTDNPTELNIKSCIEIAVWYKIDQRFDFDCHHALDKMVAHAEKHGLYDLENTKKSDALNVTLLKEHEDGSATYQFDLTPEYADALLQNGIMWAIVSGVTGITIDKVLEEYKEKDEE